MPESQQGDALLAPLWHTLLVAAAVLTVSALGLRSHAQAALTTHHARAYLLTILWEWSLAALVLWGLRLRRTPLRTLLGVERKGPRAWLRDAAIAIVFWLAALVVLGAVGVLLKNTHIAEQSKAALALAPTSGGELLLFIVLSISAGICEELLFRGYLQQQFTRLANHRIWVGVTASALLFGCAHLYEGAAGVIAITVFGAMFSLLAIERRSLRTGMIAHAWHDACSGLALFLLRHSHLL